MLPIWLSPAVLPRLRLNPYVGWKDNTLKACALGVSLQCLGWGRGGFTGNGTLPWMQPQQPSPGPPQLPSPATLPQQPSAPPENRPHGSGSSRQARLAVSAAWALALLAGLAVLLDQL